MAPNGFSNDVQLATLDAIATLPAHLFSKCPVVFLKLSALIVLPPTTLLLWTCWELDLLTHYPFGGTAIWMLQKSFPSSGFLIFAGILYGCTVAAVRVALIVVVGELYLDRPADRIDVGNCLWKGFRHLPLMFQSSMLLVLYLGSFFLAMMAVLVLFWVLAFIVFSIFSIDVSWFFLLFRAYGCFIVYLGFFAVFFCAILLSGQPILIVERINVFEGLFRMWQLTDGQRETVAIAILWYYIRMQSMIACYFGIVFVCLQLGLANAAVTITLFSLPFLLTVPLLSM